MSEIHEIKVSEEDLLSLDGKCPKSIQDVIDRIHTNNQAKTAFGLAYGLEPHLAVVLAEWLKLEKDDIENGGSGKYSYWSSESSYCSVCRKQAGYETYKRGSYLHAKGSPNYSKPRKLYVRHMRFANGDEISMCFDCHNKIKVVKEALEAAKNG